VLAKISFICFLEKEDRRQEQQQLGLRENQAGFQPSSTHAFAVHKTRGGSFETRLFTHSTRLEITQNCNLWLAQQAKAYLQART
jgi:hypothetical protein